MISVLRSYSTQEDAKRGIKEVVGDDRLTALNQALNDAFGGKGKNSGNHEVEDYGPKHILHASAGKVGKGKGSVTLFYFFDGGVFKLIAVGEHEDNGYRIDKVLGQDHEPFEKKRLVSATGSG